MTIPFFKYQGTGNDFVLIDNRDGKYQGLTEAQVAFLCNRRFGIGGDGLMLLNQKPGMDFRMEYYNSDGKPSSMCGNGGRCIARLAKNLKIIKDRAVFEAVDGMHEAIIDGDWVRLRMGAVAEITPREGHFLLDTGSPHYVRFVRDVKHIDVAAEGATVRYSPDFEAQGINVNFVQEVNSDSIFVRTYERGVEAETWSCGTGVTASALVFAREKGIVGAIRKAGATKINVRTLGGDLTVEFDSRSGVFDPIWLCGPAEFVFQGEVSI